MRAHPLPIILLTLLGIFIELLLIAAQDIGRTAKWPGLLELMKV